MLRSQTRSCQENCTQEKLFAHSRLIWLFNTFSVKVSNQHLTLVWDSLDRSPEDGTGPLDEGVGPREHYSPGPEKKGNFFCFFWRFRTFVEYHICLLKNQSGYFFGKEYKDKLYRSTSIINIFLGVLNC